MDLQVSGDEMVNVRKYLEQQWTDRATITEYRKTVDPITHESIPSVVDVMTDLPCRISFSTLVTAGINNGVANVSQTIKLFTAPDIDIKEGSIITVTREGHAEKYKRSGVPAWYNSHQEIPLEKYEEYA